MSGYKFGGHVNIGYNPAFTPDITEQYSATGANASLVAGEGNTLKGSYNYIFGRDNTILEANSSQCNIVMGSGSSIAGGVVNTLFGFDATIDENSSYSNAMGYTAMVKNSLAATVLGYGAMASGAQTSVAIGPLANATANSAVAIGMCSGTAQYAVAIGFESNGGGQTSTAIGGGSTTAENAISIGKDSNAQTVGAIALGKGNMGAGRYGGFRVNANGGRTSYASYQICQSIGQTTNATPLLIYLSEQDATDGAFICSTGKLTHFEVIVQGRVDSTTVGCVYKLEGAVVRDNNASNNPAFLGSVTKTVIHESDAGMDAAITINNTAKSLELTVTGKAATDIQWLATWHIHEN